MVGARDGDCTTAGKDGSAASMSAARTERLLNLLTLLLNARGPLPFAHIRDLSEFAAYVSADPKTGERAFERDKAALVEMGIPLKYEAPEGDGGAQGGYVVDAAGYYLPQLDLNAAEQATLSMASTAALGNPHFPLRSALTRALGKLGFDTPPVYHTDEQGSVRDSGPMGIGETRPGSGHAGLLAGADAQQVWTRVELLQGAVGARRRVRFDYRKPDDSTTYRTIDPYGVYYRQGMWYVVGHCHLRRDRRTFHVGRMGALEYAAGRGTNGVGLFQPPADFDLSAHARQMPWEYAHQAEEQVILRLAAKLVPAAAEIFGANAVLEPTQSQALGGAIVRLAVRNTEALVASLLPFGADAEVLAPPRVRRLMGQAFAALHSAYSRGVDSGSDEDQLEANP